MEHSSTAYAVESTTRIGGVGGVGGDGNVTDGTSVIVIVVASLFSALVVGGIIFLVYYMKRSRSEPMDARDLYPKQPAGRFTRRGDPNTFREHRSQQSVEQKLTEHAQAIDTLHDQDQSMNSKNITQHSLDAS